MIEGWNPINHLTPPPACACPKARPRFLSAYVVVFSMFNDLRSEVIVVEVRGDCSLC